MKVVGVKQDVDRAVAALDRAIELDSEIVDARAYRIFLLRIQGEVERSRVGMSELRRESPNSFEVQYLSGAGFRFDGEYDKALRCYQEVLRLDPTAQVTVHYCRARIYSYRGEYDRAFKEIDLADKIEPNHPIIRFFRAIGAFRSGDPAFAIKQMHDVLSTYPCKGFRPYLAICLNALGRHEEALSELSDEVTSIAAVDPDVAYWVASTYAGAGKMDLAFQWLHRSVGLGNRDRHLLQTDVLVSPMRRDARFYDLLKRVT
jgi:tetratricopeptide (TPR) repeat protein